MPALSLSPRRAACLSRPAQLGVRFRSAATDPSLSVLQVYFRAHCARAQRTKHSRKGVGRAILMKRFLADFWYTGPFKSWDARTPEDSIILPAEHPEAWSYFMTLFFPRPLGLSPFRSTRQGGAGFPHQEARGHQHAARLCRAAAGDAL